MTAAEPPPSGRRMWAWVLGCAVAALVVVAAVVVVRPGDGGPTKVEVASASTTRPPNTWTSTSASSTTAPTTTTTTTALPTTTTPPEPTIHVAFAGDLLTHLPLVTVAADYGRGHGDRYDFKPMLAPMRPVIEAADVAICHLEVPLAADQDRLSGYPSFGAPAELVDAVKRTGYDGCSTASNHSLDQGRDGIAATLDRFDLDHLKHAGTARTAEEAAATTMYDVKGVEVAHLSYAYGFNGYSIPRDAPFAVNQIDPARIEADAQRARAAGAQLVVVSLHWGAEYQHEPNPYQRDVAAQLLPSPDIDVIIGHHAHVVQPIERVEGTYVVWGLGNQLANQPEAPKSDGLTVVLHAKPQWDGGYAVSSIDAVPTWIEPGSFRVLPIRRTLADPSILPGLRGELEASCARTLQVLRSRPTSGVAVDCPGS